MITFGNLDSHSSRAAFSPGPETKSGFTRAARHRILIPISGDLFIRNFIESGAFAELEARYEVHYLVSSLVTKSLPHSRVHLVKLDDVQKRTELRYHIGYASMQRHRNRSRSFSIKYRETFFNKLRFWKKPAFKVLGLPGVCEAFTVGVETYLGTLPEVDRVVRDVAPDLMLVPSGFSDSFSIDCLKTAKKFKIRNFMLMFNWDNVSCKGVLPVLPEAMGVWGEQTQEQAVRIHGITRDRVFVLGSPQFETYFRPVMQSRDEILKMNGLPAGKKILLYLGISKYRDEIAMLDRLENAVESGELRDAHVLYRPHPWREVTAGERNFFDRGYRHISMDVQMTEHYRKMLTVPGYQAKRFVPEYEYPRSLLNAVDAVISSLTTMGIEAMIMGKPVLLPAFPDEKFPFSLDQLIEYDHHQCWKKFPDAVLCHQSEEFVPGCRKILALAGDPDTSRRVKEQVKHVVYFDQSTYSKRLADCVEGFLSG